MHVVRHAGTVTQGRDQVSRARSAVPLALAAMALSVTLASCTTADEPAAEGSGVATAPATTCDATAVAAAIADAYARTKASEGTGLALQDVSGVQCADDWAIAMVRIGDGLGHDFEDREVLQLVGGAWQVADRMVVCGTVNPRRPAAVPDDAQVPEPLYLIACQTD